MTTEAALIIDEEFEKVASGLHGFIGTQISRYLGNYIAGNRIGCVLDSSTTFNLNDNQPKPQPDVSFVTLEKMPVPLDEELNFAPDLAVEIVSKNDTAYEIEKKVNQYQQAGVKLIWVVYPLSRNVDV